MAPKKLRVNVFGSLTTAEQDFQDGEDLVFIENSRAFSKIPINDWQKRVKFICVKDIGISAILTPVKRTINGEEYQIGFDLTPSRAKDFNKEYPSWEELEERILFAIAIFSNVKSGYRFKTLATTLARSSTKEQKLIIEETKAQIFNELKQASSNFKDFYKKYSQKTQYCWPDLDYGHIHFDPSCAISESDLNEAIGAVALRKFEVEVFNYANPITKNKANTEGKLSKLSKSLKPPLTGHLKDYWECKDIPFDEFYKRLEDEDFIQNGEWVGRGRTMKVGLLLYTLIRRKFLDRRWTPRTKKQEWANVLNTTFKMDLKPNSCRPISYGFWQSNEKDLDTLLEQHGLADIFRLQ